MLIYQSKADLDEEISLDNITHLCDPTTTEMPVRSMGIENSTFHSRHNLCVQISIIYVFKFKYTTLNKQPRFGNLSKSLSIVNMKISSPDSDLAPKLYFGYVFSNC